jgi:hypothetical protein
MDKLRDKNGRKMKLVDGGCDKCVCFDGLCMHPIAVAKRRDGGAAVLADLGCACGEGYIFDPTPDTPTLDEWESAIADMPLLQIMTRTSPAAFDRAYIVELRQPDGVSTVRFCDADGTNNGSPVIRRKPQTTTLNFDRPTFAAVGAQFVASGTPGQQPPKGSAWLSVASIVHGGIWMANSSGQQFMTTWDQLSVGGYVYTSDHGATWHACNRTVTKGA